MSTYPTELKNPPIIESIIEIKFNSSLPNEAVFGVFYEKLKDRYDDIEQLNTANLPKQILDEQPELKFAPHYNLKSEGKPLNVLIGPKVIIFKYQKYNKDVENEYPGWNKYLYTEIIEILSTITEAGYIKEILRVGLRTIDFVEDEIFSHLNIDISMSNRELKNVAKSFRFQIKENDFNNTIAISNNSSLIKNGTPHNGSTIDVDTSKEESITTDIEEYLKAVIKEGHETNKSLFFELLKEEYIAKLKEE
ncbi:TIGR04255 family protein [Arcobacter sp. YIC-464]|uniref:TIGR04255 family protein n=1 Tax=Arcobacter sp. YIC-464 TaxID=3376631 RepID=UPI003C26692C